MEVNNESIGKFLTGNRFHVKLRTSLLIQIASVKQ